ncbi:DUF4199 domain-containing protein [Flavobacterium silvisoli]|uniref:DUF4199 domain-containing protein n=1 Tax=Flavobacterium silvisoli TaxID=2529433 RepID=A0A4Q9Z213_9FLAO|nr:DUF4199 domain-containing protein [Flavobacterium silvisoli]TBX70174.1 DUF4199 domain-containing protein [Flavobacterium silvisoli]
MKKIVLTYGLMAGGIVAAFMLFGVYLFSNNPNFDAGMLLGYAGMIIAFSLCYVGIKNYRDRQNEGIISFGKALSIGLMITFIASTIYVGVWLIEYYCFFPDFMDKYIASALKKLDTTTMTAAEIKAKTAELMQYKELYKSPIMVILLTYAEALLPVGLLVPIICAWILKRKTKQV